MKVDNLIGEQTKAAQTEPIVVVCAADDNYAMPLAVTIRSVVENLNKNLTATFFVIDGGISDRNKRRILKSLDLARCEIKWITKPESVINNSVIPYEIYTGTVYTAHISIATWYRILIPELLPQQVEKAIYLDCDLVVTEDLGKLWNIDVEENYLLAIPRLVGSDGYGAYVSSILENWKELGVSENSKYFNAGVLVFNLSKWRSECLCTKALNYIANNQKYIRWGDQDVLNAIAAERCGSLDPRWNRMNPPNMTQSEVEDSFILHYTTAAKPWIVAEQYPAKDVFFYYLDITDWAGYRHTIPQRLWRRLKREIKQRFA